MNKQIRRPFIPCAPLQIKLFYLIFLRKSLRATGPIAIRLYHMYLFREWQKNIEDIFRADFPMGYRIFMQ